MERTIITINAKNKAEAKAGLEMLFDLIESYPINTPVIERVCVTNEGKQIISDNKEEK